MTLVVITLVLAGCGHEHTFSKATCLEPQTCTECGATDGTALGHAWKDATCQAPKTCSICDITEGSVAAHNYIDGTCSMCGSTDPKIEQVSNAKAAYADLLIAESYCDVFSTMISDAWYFAIYKSDDYYDGDKAISAFSSYVGIEKSLVKEGVDSYLKKMSFPVNSVSRGAVLATNSGALYVVNYGLTNNEGFKNAKECIDSAQKKIQALNPDYASVNAYSDLTGYYSAVCAYYEFCYSPSGSYSQLSSTRSVFRTNCATYRNRCELCL